MTDQPPGIDSFVIRFVRPGSKSTGPDPGPPFRGVIRHVQSNKERSFTEWGEAETFIRRYIHLESLTPSQTKPQNPKSI